MTLDVYWRSRCAKTKRHINLADYIEGLRELKRQSNTPAQEENSPKKTTIGHKERRKTSK